MSRLNDAISDYQVSKKEIVDAVHVLHTLFIKMTSANKHKRKIYDFIFDSRITALQDLEVFGVGRFAFKTLTRLLCTTSL